MKKVILINSEEKEKRVAILDDGALQDYSFERAKGRSLVGNVYKGRVSNILQGIQAAFVDIGLERNGFLHMSDILSAGPAYEELMGEKVGEKKGDGERSSIQQVVRKGQELIVQVVKDPIGTKGVRLTTHASLPGRYLVFMPIDDHRGVSRKIADREERARLRKILSELKIQEGCGVIVRTVGANQQKKPFARDLNYLQTIWKKMEKLSRREKAPALLHEEFDLVLRTIRDCLTEEVEKVVVDSSDEYRKIKRFLRAVAPRLRWKMEIYNGKTPLFEKYGIDSAIERSLRRKIWLKCGGYIIFDEGEALVSVDVNTGKHKGKKDLEETILKTNLEAADEAALQLRLRDVGGIIVIDFIDMNRRRNQRAVFQRLREALKRDRARTKIYPISDLGLLEMTRQRVKESASDAVHENCPYCAGSGVIKTFESMTIEIMRKLRRTLRLTRRRAIRVEAHPRMVEGIRQREGDVVAKIRREHRAKIEWEGRDDLHFEEFRFVCPKTGEVIEDPPAE